MACSTWRSPSAPGRTCRERSQPKSESDVQEALAFLDQAKDFYETAADRVSANPLLYYYAFLNLGKALLRTLGHRGSLDQAMHGLTERRLGGGTELADGRIVVRDGGTNVVNIFPELIEQLGYERPADEAAYPVPALLAQVVVGHRLWKEAARRTERFIDLKEIEVVDNRDSKELWLRLYVARGDLRRYDIRYSRVLREGGIGGYRQVAIEPTERPSDYVCFEQENSRFYTGRPTDVLQEHVDETRVFLWRIISSRPEQGYRRYYLYLSPAAEQQYRVPQIFSIWALLYHFGSVVRYRPQMFDSITSDRFGAVVTEFISAQPNQLLYLLASEMCRREVARPAIV